MRVGVNNTFHEFCCGGMQRNRAIGGGRSVSSIPFLFKTREIIVHLFADGNDPVEKEKLTLQERGRIAGVMSGSSASVEMSALDKGSESVSIRRVRKAR